MKGSRCLNCPFSATLLQSKGVGGWVLQIRDNGHNHMPSSTSTHPSHRRAQVNAHIDSIQSQLATSHILTFLRQNSSMDISIKARDVYNLRRKQRQEFLDCSSPIQALLIQIPDGGDWICNWETEASDNVITGVFYTHKMGAINRPTSQEQASTQETSIHRDPSEFEVILQEGRGRGPETRPGTRPRPIQST